MAARRIGFAGDVMFGRVVDERQRRRPVDAVWGDLRDRLDALDGFVINLECCLSTRGEPWQRTQRPFHFRAAPGWAVPALRRAGVDCCALANNHVLDFEEGALEDTFDALDDVGDFVDDYAVDDRLRNDRGFLFERSVTDRGQPAELRLVPTEIRDCAVHRASPEAAAWSRERVRERSAAFGTGFDRDGAALVLPLDG